MKEQEDPREKYQYGLWVAKAPFLVAVGDDTELTVLRSYALSTNDDPYLPVAEYIRELGFVMVETETTRHEQMLGRVERTRYTTPEKRNLILANRAEASS